MRGLDFPIVKTKTPGVNQKFNINNPDSRKEYFNAKIGKEIEKLKTYLNKNSFIAYLLAKKSAGKGTYTKLFMEIFGEDSVAHLSVGDIVRDIDRIQHDEEYHAEVEEYMKEHYRGYISLDDALESIKSRDTKSLLSTEFILALLKKHIDDNRGKALFIDGFPRDLDQISYSLYFRDLINYSDAPDMFVLIDVPEIVIDERMKYRVVCPVCQTPRNTKLLATEFVGFDEKKSEYFLMCDSPECDKAVMVRKEGDELGIEAIRERIDKDGELIKKVFDLHGVPKVYLRNAVPADVAEDMVDDYEITPGYSYEGKGESIKTIESNWTFEDDNGIKSHSLLAPPVVITMVKQMVEILNL